MEPTLHPRNRSLPDSFGRTSSALTIGNTRRRQHFDFAIWGRSIWDDWRDSPSDEQEAHSNFGGSGANVATALAQLGFTCCFVTKGGTDALSSAYLSHLESTIAHVDMIQAAPEIDRIIFANGVATWASEECGYPTFGDRGSEYGDAAAAIFISESEIAAPPGSWAARSYWMPGMMLKTDPDACVEASLRHRWRAVFLNTREAERLQEARHMSMLEISRHSPVQTWIITNGPEPTLVLRHSSRLSIAPPSVHVRLPVGGGDGFAAGFCASEALGFGVEESVRNGHRLSARIVTQIHAQLTGAEMRSIWATASNPSCGE